MPCCWLRHDLGMFPTLTETSTISGSLKQYCPFYGPFSGRLPVLKVKRELQVLALPPNEVLSQLQFCRAISSFGEPCHVYMGDSVPDCIG
jgi:hypothetical protein